MNKVSKIIFLICILAIPLVIFIFLKLFGENQFDIPVYYSEGVPPVRNLCSIGEGPYVIADTTLNFKGNPVVSIMAEGADNAYQLSNNIARLKNEFGGSVDIYAFTSTDSLQENSDIINVDREGYKKLYNCNFLITSDSNFVLIDADRRIRGYYTSSREEIDRLIVELKILLENE